MENDGHDDIPDDASSVFELAQKRKGLEDRGLRQIRLITSCHAAFRPNGLDHAQARLTRRVAYLRSAAA